MTTNPTETDGSHLQPAINLAEAAIELLKTARASKAGRAARTLAPGAGAPLKQTLMALVAGNALGEHESPDAATLQVVIGAVRLTAGSEAVELGEHDHAPIPSARHGLQALVDAVVLISVGQGVVPPPDAPDEVGMPVE